MAVALSYPGVYIQEAESGVRTIVGVGTSTALFIGRTAKGPFGKPVRCLSLSDFVRTFSDDVAVGDMARYVRLFYQNGGTDCYVMRIASGEQYSEVTLLNEAEQAVLKLVARDPGLGGESIRAEVSYRGPHPEARFNLRLFRWGVNHRGESEKQDDEEWTGLSMDLGSPQYAVDLLNQRSALVTASIVPDGNTPDNGYSLSGRPVAHATGEAGSFRNAWVDLINSDVLDNTLEISVDGSAYALVDLSSIDIEVMSATEIGPAKGQLASAVETAIEGALLRTGVTAKQVKVTFEDGPTPAGEGNSTCLLRIASVNSGDVFIRPSRPNDAAVRLMLGTAQGGLEVGAYAMLRPAPNGLGLRVTQESLIAFAGTQQGQLGLPSVDAAQVPSSITAEALVTTSGLEPTYHDGYPKPSATGNSDGVREKLALMRDGINGASPSIWRAELWGHRLVLIPKAEDDNHSGTMTLAGWNGTVCNNVRRYSLGLSGAGDYQQPASLAGSDGSAPDASDYAAAYRVVEKEVDLFNLLVLPPDREPSVAMEDLWSEASTFCAARRAFLLMDPPDTWVGAQAASEMVSGLRVGLVNDHSAVFFPKLSINEGGRQITVGPAGAIAGLMARIDSARGVWKAPAGMEASLRGAVGLQHRFSDGENGLLNPRGINTIRIFPSGIVNWGGRTLAGDDDFASEWKYIPVRRLALYIEESLYRGTQWVVFEPNDEPLWSQIRLNVGAFMNNLFRQGAFQGASAREAYFVKCDRETTTQNDIDRGIVNIWVGFAPLKPAEFVVVTIRQMAGQVQA